MNTAFLFFDVIKYEGGESSNNWIEFLKLLIGGTLAGCTVYLGVLWSNSAEKRKSRRRALFSLNLFETTVATIVQNAKLLSAQQDAISGKLRNDKYINLKYTDKNINELMIIKNMDLQEVYEGFLICFNEEKSGITSYLNILSYVYQIEEISKELIQTMNSNIEILIPLYRKHETELNKFMGTTTNTILEEHGYLISDSHTIIHKHWAIYRQAKLDSIIPNHNSGFDFDHDTWIEPLYKELSEMPLKDELANRFLDMLQELRVGKYEIGRLATEMIMIVNKNTTSLTLPIRQIEINLEALRPKLSEKMLKYETTSKILFRG